MIGGRGWGIVGNGENGNRNSREKMAGGEILVYLGAGRLCKKKRTAEISGGHWRREKEGKKESSETKKDGRSQKKALHLMHHR